MLNDIFSATTYSQTQLNNNQLSNKVEDRRSKNADSNKNVESNNKTEKTDGVKYESRVSDRDKKMQMASMLNQAELQTQNFQKLISSIFTKQSDKVRLVGLAKEGNLKNFFSNLKVDAQTVAKAKKDISENGYYGVKQTSERILSFAKAAAGNDPKKIDEMRKAVEKGFKSAEKMWGGKLPEISQQTYDTVMNEFDKWKTSATSGIEPRV